MVFGEISTMVLSFFIFYLDKAEYIIDHTTNEPKSQSDDLK
jgi:hypothetical protein